MRRSSTNRSKRAREYFLRWYRPRRPTRRSAHLIESRFALSRVVAAHLELELAWTARSPLSMVDLLRVEDQRVAAMIRFVP